MTHHTRQLKAAWQRSGLALIGLTFEKAMSVRCIRVSLEGTVSAEIRKHTQGKPAPIQPALI